MMFPFSHFMPAFLLYSTGGSGEKPPKKKWTRLVALIIVLAVVLTFFLIMAFEKDRNAVNVNYNSVVLSGDTLSLRMQYDAEGELIKFGQHTIVAKDKEFTELLPLKKRKSQDGNYVYEFDAAALRGSVTLYVKPPIFFTPTEITPVSIPAAVGETSNIRIDKTGIRRAKDLDWFTVEAVDMEAAGNGSFTAKITLDAQANYMPRLSKLVSGDARCDGSATPYFDANDNLDSVEILFTLPVDSEDAAAAFMENATLEISSAAAQADISVSDHIGTITSTTEQGTRKLSFEICKPA